MMQLPSWDNMAPRITALYVISASCAKPSKKSLGSHRDG